MTIIAGAQMAALQFALKIAIQALDELESAPARQDTSAAYCVI
jgi:hypothetical protein